MKTINFEPFKRRIDPPVELEEEGGITQISLNNAWYSLERFGYPTTLELVEEKEEWFVYATWKNDKNTIEVRHKFSGFSWGYGGEGPHGLMIFLEALGLNDIASQVVDGQFKNLPQKVALNGNRRITII